MNTDVMDPDTIAIIATGYPLSELLLDELGDGE